MIFSLIIGFVLGVGAIVFILQNTEVVALAFMGLQFESSLAVVVILAILLGIVLSLLVSLPGAIGSSIQMGKLKKEINNLRAEADKYKQTANEATARMNASVPPLADRIG
ncbi:MAG: hypothetical protein JWN64_734 [Parcubacteria group bacterium]|nr:hypothetical protein [Parcubacteria group bacterium]